MDRHPMGRCRRRRLTEKAVGLIDAVEGLAIAQGRGDVPAQVQQSRLVDLRAEQLAEYLAQLLKRRGVA
jgi:hypothetical protein